MVHKKVRLSDDLLAWEHERFSIKRLSAATISSLQNHKNLRRSSMFESRYIHLLGGVGGMISGVCATSLLSGK